MMPEADWAKLPRNEKKKLAKNCFIYEEARDTYYCPMGQEMPYRETKYYDRSHGKQAIRIYGCKGCPGCPLARKSRRTAPWRKARRARSTRRRHGRPEDGRGTTVPKSKKCRIISPRSLLGLVA